MPDSDPDDDRALRDAFDGFRSHALDDLPAPGADAVRTAARRRRHVHQTMAAAAVGVVLVVGGGSALLATRNGDQPQHITAAASASATHSAPTPTGAPPSSGPTGHPGTSPGGTDHGGAPSGGTTGLAVSVGSAPAVRSTDGYSADLTVTVRNTGAQPISRAVVLVQPGNGLSVQDEGSCPADGCRLGEVHDLAPGAASSVTGTLAYLQTEAPTTMQSGGTVTVTAQDEQGAALGTVSQPFQVEGGASPTPTDDATPSTSPTSPPPSPTPDE